MTKIRVSPATYQKGVERYGEEQFSARFVIDPDHCDHAFDIAQVIPVPRHTNRGKQKYQIVEICRKCKSQNPYGLELWGKP